MDGEISIDRANRDMAEAVIGLVKAQTRLVMSGDQPPHIFTGLEGQDIFVAGHRFHVIGTLDKVEIDRHGDPIAYLNCVHQISYDEEDNIPKMYFLGEGMRLPVTSVGWVVQPISQRPPGYRKAWETAKAARISATPAEDVSE